MDRHIVFYGESDKTVDNREKIYYNRNVPFFERGLIQGEIVFFTNRIQLPKTGFVKKGVYFMAKKQISKSGAAKLREELDYLVTVRRQEMAQKLKEARAQGDLSENAEYDEAKNEQAILEAQIAEIQFTLDNSEEVDDTDISLDEVGLGSTLKLKNYQTGKIESLQIVSVNEADFLTGKISDESPIGKAAMKKKVGDTFIVEAPAGEMKFEIIEIGK